MEQDQLQNYFNRIRQNFKIWKRSGNILIICSNLPSRIINETLPIQNQTNRNQFSIELSILTLAFHCKLQFQPPGYHQILVFDTHNYSTDFRIQLFRVSDRLQLFSVNQCYQKSSYFFVFIFYFPFQLRLIYPNGTRIKFLNTFFCNLIEYSMQKSTKNKTKRKQETVLPY